MGFPDGSVYTACNVGDARDEGSIPGSGRSLKEEMATQSSILAWKIPQEEELQSAAAKSLQSCWTLCHPIDSSPPGSPSLGFSRQEYWSGVPLPSLSYSLWGCTEAYKTE